MSSRSYEESNFPDVERHALAAEFLNSPTAELYAKGHFSISSRWTSERLSILEELWYDDKSISEIAKELDISRNAVGKVHRLGLAKRNDQSASGHTLRPHLGKINSTITKLFSTPSVHLKYGVV